MIESKIKKKKSYKIFNVNNLMFLIIICNTNHF